MKKSDLTVAVDAGHGRGVFGKRSPDGVFQEWSWNKDVAEIVVQSLKANGFNAFLVNPEERDIALMDRTKRINEKCGSYYTDKVMSVSIHVNAAGNGKQWMNARGWEVYTYTYPNPNSVKLANCIYDEAVKAGFKTRPESPTQHYRKKNLAMCREPRCPAVLVENFFMDNKDDLEYLLSPISIYACADVIVGGIMAYANKLCMF